MTRRKTPGGNPPRANRTAQQERLFQIRQLLHRPGGVSLADITARFGCSERSAARDIENLERSLPLKKSLDDDGRSYRWHVPEPQRLPFDSLAITRRAMVSLFIVRENLSWARGTFVHDDLEHLCRQLEITLDHADEIEDLDRKFYDVGEDVVRFDRRHFRPEHLEHLLEGVLSRWRVNVRYEDDPETFALDPYSFVTSHKAFYLVARSHRPRHQEEPLRTFRLDRFHAVHLQEPRVPFHYDPIGYHPARFFKGAFGMFTDDKPETVRIALTADAAGRIRSRAVHPSERYSTLDDGRQLLTLRVALPRTKHGLLAPSLVAQILQWGDGAEVLEPAKLRAEVQGVLARALRAYSLSLS